jgi:hypothetical protein
VHKFTDVVTPGECHRFGAGVGGLTQILSSLDNVTSTLKQVATDLAASIIQL